MDYEITVSTRRHDEIIVRFHDDHPEDTGSIHLGRKVMLAVGEFKYEWLIEMLDVDEVTSLIEVLQFALDKVRAANSTEPLWYEYDEPQYAPDGAHCPRCNYFTEKPHKFYSGCAACDERGEAR